MTDLDKLCADLRGMMEKATPGEWVSLEDNDICTRAPITGNVVCLSPEVVMAASLEKWADNRALICAAKNALPTLLDALTALQAERDHWLAECQRVLRAGQDAAHALTAAQETIGRLEEALPDEIDIYRIIKRAGVRKHGEIAKAVAAALSDRRGGVREGNILSFPSREGRTIATIEVIRMPNDHIAGRLVDMSAAEIEAEATIAERFEKVIGWLALVTGSLSEQAKSFEDPDHAQP